MKLYKIEMYVTSDFDNDISIQEFIIRTEEIGNRIIIVGDILEKEIMAESDDVGFDGNHPINNVYQNLEYSRSVFKTANDNSLKSQTLYPFGKIIELQPETEEAFFENTKCSSESAKEALFLSEGEQDAIELIEKT